MRCKENMKQVTHLTVLKKNYDEIKICVFYEILFFCH